MNEKIQKAYGQLACFVTEKRASDLLPLSEEDMRAMDEVLDSLGDKYPYKEAIRIKFELDGKWRTTEEINQHFGMSYASIYNLTKTALRKLSRIGGSRFDVFNNLFKSTLKEQAKNRERKIQDLEVYLRWKSEEAENWKILFLNQISIEKLEIQGKAPKRLAKAGINTIGALVNKTEEELLVMEDFGLVMLNRIKTALWENGLSLKGELSQPMPWEKVKKGIEYLLEKI